jgi:hypothetical protein
MTFKCLFHLIEPRMFILEDAVYDHLFSYVPLMFGYNGWFKVGRSSKIFYEEKVDW